MGRTTILRSVAVFAIVRAIALLCAGPAAVGAQVIRGVVVEAESRTPIPGATIELLGEVGRAPIKATSDSAGLFVINIHRAGTFTIQARRLGFMVAEPDTVTLERDQVLSVEMRLGASAVPLEPVHVTARKVEWLADFERRRSGAFGRFITRKTIEERAPIRTSDLFSTMPGFVLTRQRRGQTVELQMRGTAGLCQPAVWLDGLLVSQNVSGSMIDALVSPQMLEGVEVYNSVASAPPEFRAGNCGVLVFWTKQGGTDGRVGASWKKALLGAGAAVLFIVLVSR
jgi:hypothetical protein